MHCSATNRILSICNHVKKDSFPNGCYPGNRFANDTEARLLITSDRSHIPRPHFQIKGLSRIQLMRYSTSLPAYYLSVPFITESRINPDSKENICFFFNQINITDQFFSIYK